MKSDTFRTALVQMDSGSDWEANKRMAVEFVKEAAAQGADYVQLPETADYIGDDFTTFSGRHVGEAERFFRELAQEYEVYLNCGSITEYHRCEKPRNTTLFFGPDGTLLGRYSKLHLFDVDVEEGPCYRESDEIQAGTETCVVPTDLGTFGLSICYDMRFPELYRRMASQDAVILCVSANFTKHTGIHHWKPLLQARAIENTCYILAAGQCGRKPKFQAYGHSMIIDPWGEILLEMDEEPGIAVIDIDLERIEQVRGQLPCLKNMRHDMFQI